MIPVLLQPLYATPPSPVRRFSVAEYLDLFAKGVLEQDEKVELLDGWIFPKMARNPPHDGILALIVHVLGGRVPAGWHVRPQLALLLAQSVPEPDVAVVVGGHRDYLARHPTAADVALLVEVADSSLAHDRDVKGPLYAAAGVPVYWVVDVAANVIEVYTNPSPAGYLARQDFAVGDVVPLVVAGALAAQVAAADLLG